MTITLAPDNHDLLKPNEVTGLLGVHYVTLAVWRANGTGPAFIKLGSGVRAPVRYRASAIYDYLTGNSRKEDHEQNQN